MLAVLHGATCEGRSNGEVGKGVRPPTEIFISKKKLLDNVHTINMLLQCSFRHVLIDKCHVLSILAITNHGDKILVMNPG